MFRKMMIALLVVTVTLTGSLALAGPEGSVRGGSRERVPVLNAKDFNLASLEGKVVMVAFWQGFNCPTCEAYISWLTEMQGLYLEDGLVVVAVNVDRDSAAAKDLANKIHERSQIVLDPTGRMVGSYELESVPSTYLHDRNLNLVAKFVDFVPGETDSLVTTITELLEKEYED
jgi:cytochrome c biogenesis protein CcmG/thiol:disulfide interchange protein DsbE